MMQNESSFSIVGSFMLASASSMASQEEAEKMVAVKLNVPEDRILAIRHPSKGWVFRFTKNKKELSKKVELIKKKAEFMSQIELQSIFQSAHFFGIRKTPSVYDLSFIVDLLEKDYSNVLSILGEDSINAIESHIK